MSLPVPAYEQLAVLLRQVIADNPHDQQVLRLAKGLVKAVDRWLQLRSPLSQHDQARNGTPRAQRLASANASLASLGADAHGESTRTEGAD
jgi:hypothetical protein